MAEDSADIYRQRAAEMKAQAQRAETVYLQAIYSSIADNWDRLAAQMQAADRAGKKDHATGNWEKLAQEMHREIHADMQERGEHGDESPPPGLVENTLAPVLAQELVQEQAQDRAVTGRL